MREKYDINIESIPCFRKKNPVLNLSIGNSIWYIFRIWVIQTDSSIRKEIKDRDRKKINFESFYIPLSATAAAAA